MLREDECWQLLSSHDVGRVAYTRRALPAIATVGYALVGHRVLLHCRDDDLAAALDGQVVAFQVDAHGSGSGAGWSVLTTGTASRLSSPTDRVRSPRERTSWTNQDEPAAVSLTIGALQARRPTFDRVLLRTEAPARLV